MLVAQMRMSADEVASTLENALAPGYAFNFRVVGVTQSTILLEAVAGNMEGIDNQLLEYRVSRHVDYIESGQAFYMVEYRPKENGWIDAEGGWRWATHVSEMIPNDPMHLYQVLSYEGLQVNVNATAAAGLEITGLTTIHGARDWLYGITGALENPITYAELLAIPGAVEDIEE